MALEIHLFNTLTKQKEVFTPITPGRVSMYHCGPTVYDFAHIGNLRSYIFSDTLRRVFEANNFKAHQVINITDVGHLVSDGDDGEDKMTKALKREGKPMTLEAMREIADVYANAFFADLEALNIMTEGTIFPRASAYISEQIHLIERLDQAGLVYKTTDGLYFDTTQFPEYGKLGGVALVSEEDAQARVQTNTEKKNPRDFALWKFNPELGWDTIWGKGFPGWHLECSAMAMRLLGETIDIHTGGIDHVNVHHNNEIAQSEGATGHPFVHYWMHGAFLSLNKEKVAKSTGNTLYLKDLVAQGYSGIHYRYLLLGAHYRTSIDFSLEALSAAKTGYENLIEKIAKVLSETPTKTPSEHIQRGVKETALEIVNDDLNTAALIAYVWETLGDRGLKPQEKIDRISFADNILGLELISAAQKREERNRTIPEEVLSLAEKRLIARKSQDWNTSDSIRSKIEGLGFSIKDLPDGSQSITPLA